MTIPYVFFPHRSQQTQKQTHDIFVQGPVCGRGFTSHFCLVKSVTPTMRNQAAPQTRLAVQFTAPGIAETLREAMPLPAPGEVLVATTMSGKLGKIVGFFWEGLGDWPKKFEGKQARHSDLSCLFFESIGLEHAKNHWRSVGFLINSGIWSADRGLTSEDLHVCLQNPGFESARIGKIGYICQ